MHFLIMQISEEHRRLIRAVVTNLVENAGETPSAREEAVARIEVSVTNASGDALTPWPTVSRAIWEELGERISALITSTVRCNWSDVRHPLLEDIEQDVAVELFRGLCTIHWENEGTLAAWLHTVARRRGQRILERNRVDPAAPNSKPVEGVELDDEKSLQGGAYDPSDDEAIVGMELDRLALRHEPEMEVRRFAAWMLRNAYGESFREIAASEGVHADVVRRRVNELRDHLRRVLAGRPCTYRPARLRRGK